MTAELAFDWVLQGTLTERLAVRAAELVGLAVLAAVLAGTVALVYRWYTRERVPGGLPVLVGLSGVAVAVGATGVLRQVISDGNGAIDEAAVLLNVVTMLASAGAARVGTDVGDRVGTDLFVATGAKAVESEVSRVVQAVGRVITVEVPDEVDDIVGYDPVPAETKEKLAGKTFVFPRRLTVAELRDRLVTRLKADYAVGHVDIELAEDGTVEYLALGSRAAGIGPTLPPETSAVAVRADPAFAASAGDLVQVWRRDPFERVLTAEVRATVKDVVTLAVDAADTRKLDDGTTYKLVTLPVESRPDREFVSLLQAADETMAAVTVAAGSALDGQPVGALDVAVVAVRSAEGAVEPLPGRDRLLGPGESLYLVATPEAIRKVETAASPPTERRPTASSGAELPPESQVDATRLTDESPAKTDDAGPAGEPVTDESRTEAGRNAGTGESTNPRRGGSSTASGGSVGVDAAATPDTAADPAPNTAPEQDESGDPTAARDENRSTTDQDTGGTDDEDIELGDPDLADLDTDGSDDVESDRSSDAEPQADDPDDGEGWTYVGDENRGDEDAANVGGDAANVEGDTVDSDDVEAGDEDDADSDGRRDGE